MGLIDRIKHFALGGSISDNPTTPPEEEVTETEVDTQRLGSDIMNEYLGFLDGMEKDLYLSDLLVFRSKKEMMKDFNLKNDIPDENEEAMQLAMESGFYEQLSKKPYYEKLPFKKDLLKWLPDVQSLHDFKIGLNLNPKTLTGGVDVSGTK